jgi:hypothetical protein
MILSGFSGMMKPDQMTLSVSLTEFPTGRCHAVSSRESFLFSQGRGGMLVPTNSPFLTLFLAI